MNRNATAESAPSAKKTDTLPPTSTLVRGKRYHQEDLSGFEDFEGFAEPTARPSHARSERPAKSSTLAPNSVASRMVAALVARGVTRFFGVPGGPICPLFEALRLNDDAILIESRHENHAAFSAAAYYRTTGRVAAIVVTAGPGLTNAVTGIASAYSERVPLLVLTGDVAWSTHGGRLAQDSGPEGIHVESILASITRARVRITNGRSALSQTMSALSSATDPVRPGPALVILPIDRATEEAPDLKLPEPSVPRTIAPDALSVRTAATWLSEAKRPLIVLGSGCIPHAARVRQLVDAFDVPFVTTPRAKGVVSEEHPRSLRNGGMAASNWAKAYTKESVDVALVLGSDLDDTSIGPTPYLGAGGRLIHVDLDPLVFNRNLPTALGVQADLGHFADDLYELIVSEGLTNGRGRGLMKEVRKNSAFDIAEFQSDDGFMIPPHRAIADLEAAAGPNARFVTDIGEHMLFMLHYLTAKGPDDFHIQLNLGSMGSGIAGATGLALGDPERPVVCVCGDGCMQMSGMEILTSKKHNLPIIYAVFNDSRYNMVHHGMKQIFGETSGYDVPQVDFTAWAASMGVPARTIYRAGEISPELLDELLSCGGPVLLDIRIDRESRIRAGGRVEALQHMSMLAQKDKN